MVSFLGIQRYSSMSDLRLQRPKEYIKRHRDSTVSYEPRLASEERSTYTSPPVLRRPRDFQEQCYDHCYPLTVQTSPQQPVYISTPQPGISVF